MIKIMLQKGHCTIKDALSGRQKAPTVSFLLLQKKTPALMATEMIFCFVLYRTFLPINDDSKKKRYYFINYMRVSSFSTSEQDSSEGEDEGAEGRLLRALS